MDKKAIKELEKLVKELGKIGGPKVKIVSGKQSLEKMLDDGVFVMLAKLMEKNNLDANATFDDFYKSCKEMMDEQEKEVIKHVDKGFKEAKYKKDQLYLKSNAKWGAYIKPTVVYPLQALFTLLKHTEVKDAKGLILHALEEVTNYVKEKEL